MRSGTVGAPGHAPSQAALRSESTGAAQCDATGRKAARSSPASWKSGAQSGSGHASRGASIWGGTAWKLVSRPCGSSTTSAMPDMSAGGSFRSTMPSRLAAISFRGLWR
jgi:hypothetical protein